MTSNEHQIAGPKSRPQKSAVAVAAFPLLNRPCASNGLASGESFVPLEDAGCYARLPDRPISGMRMRARFLEIRDFFFFFFLTCVIE